MNKDYTPKISKKIHIEEIKNTNGLQKIFLVLDPDVPAWAFVNENGLEILHLCNGINSIEDISHRIAAKHSLSYKDSIEIIQSFLSNFKRNKVLYDKLDDYFPDNEFRCLSLEITKKCNLNCIHCYLSAGKANKNELNLDEIKHLLKATKDLGAKSIALGGGEPLLRDDCFEIIEYASSLNLLISLGTNGTLIDGERASFLSKFPIKIQISIDGANSETHDKIRGLGSYKSTIRGIEFLLKKNMGKDIVIAFVPMKINVHELPDIIDFALEHEIPVIQFPPLSPSGRARKNWDELKLSNEEMLWFWEFVSKRAEELKGKMDLLADCFSINIANSAVPYRCSIGTQLRIDPMGNVFPCQCFHFGTEYLLGNIRELSLEEIVHGSQLKEIIKACFQRPLKIEECRKCPWRNFCGAGCMGIAYETSGTILQSISCEVRNKWIDKLFKKELNKIINRNL